MKKSICIVSLILVLSIVFCACAGGFSLNNSNKITVDSFEGNWELIDGGISQAFQIQGNNARLMVTNTGASYNRSLSTSFDFIEEDSKFNLYQNGKYVGEIEYVNGNSILVKGVGSFSGTYYAVDSLDLK